MEFTKEPYILTTIYSGEGRRLELRSTKLDKTVSHFVYSVDVVSFGLTGNNFYCSSEEPLFLLPCDDYEVIESRAVTAPIKMAEKLERAVSPMLETGQEGGSSFTQNERREMVLKGKKRRGKRGGRSHHPDSQGETTSLVEEQKNIPSEENTAPVQEVQHKQEEPVVMPKVLAPPTMLVRMEDDSVQQQTE